MYDVNDDAKAGFRRVEVLTGSVRRRRWSAEEKARIIAETLAPDASVSEVARRWQILPQQVFGWRRQARVDGSAPSSEPAGGVSPAFVPIIATPAVPVKASGSVTPVAIEIKLAGAVVRVVSGTDVALLSEVLRAVRASSTAT